MSEEKKGKKIAACAKCGEEKVIIGRGLCQKCYFEERKAGTLDKNYPSKRVAGVKKAKPRKAAPDNIVPGMISVRPRVKQTPKGDESNAASRLLLAALDAIGQAAEDIQGIRPEISLKLYAAIGRLEREARKACVL